MAPTMTPIPATVLFSHADQQICRSARVLWPGSQIDLGTHVPSVTGYVRTIHLDGTPLFAKYSLLGLSLVSVLRGTCGSWTAVQQAQDAYVASPHALLAREAGQLRLLRRAGLKTPHVTGLDGGVLFTMPVAGPTLGDLVAKDPERTEALITGVLRILRDGLRRINTAEAEAVAIGERSIPATFTRKFNGLSGAAYLRQAGPHCSVLTAIVSRLQRMRMAPVTGARPLVYGDLKPEHVVYVNGPDCAPIFIDPGMGLGRPQADHAKLLSRLILSLFADPPAPAAVHAITTGLSAVAEHAVAGLGKTERSAWLRELVLLWLMDTVNIVSTYLTCPVVLPLPPQAVTITEQAASLLGLLDAVSTDLATRDPRTVWSLALSRLSQGVAR
ncbi:hypothetical protein ACFPFX_32765 [Streptomyces mauvecolor]|uniref:Aminoglycoside phosphotransferase domain-containing protein n=1 Tax=Streptomyces mauvecolor TaxID=58345 RepID=A0ABV9UXE2_9ACTN